MECGSDMKGGFTGKKRWRLARRIALAMRGSLLGCVIFFWPWTACEVGALMSESRGQCREGVRFRAWSSVGLGFIGLQV